MDDINIYVAGLAGNETASYDDNSMWLFILYMDTISALPVDIVKIITSLYYSIGILANIMLLVYLIKYKRYRSPTFMLITSLACCDFGTCFGGLVLTSVTMPYLLGPSWICKFCIYSAGLFFSASVLHLVFFSILRFIQLVYPLKAQAHITPSLVFKCCLLFWTIVVVEGYAMTTYYIDVEYSYGKQILVSCIIIEKYGRLVVFMEFVFLFCSNVVIMGFHITKHVVLKVQLRNDISTSENQSQKRQATDARAITLVIAMFCITSQPQLLHTLIHFVFNVPLGKYHMLIHAVSLNMMLGNAAMDPFIYVMCAKSVRQDIVKMFLHRDGE